MKLRQAARVDENQKAIVKTLRGLGCSVVILSMGGVPDLLVGSKGKNWLLEVKRYLVRGKVFRRDTKLTGVQREFHERWKGQIAIVHSPDEALKVLGLNAINYERMYI